MNLLVTYDVATDTPEGRKRLRSVAKACEAFGQRVQLSVFECAIGPADIQRFRMRLLKIIDPQLDSLRIYTLSASADRGVEVHGYDRHVDFGGPMII